MPLQAREKSFGLHSLSDEPFCSWIHLQSDAVYETRVTALTAKEHIPDTIWRIAPPIIFDLSRPSSILPSPEFLLKTYLFPNLGTLRDFLA